MNTFNVDAVKEAAINFASSEVMADDAVKAITKEMGTAPTFTLWGLVSAQFKVAYKEARKATDDAVEKAWSRMAARMKAAYGMEKPKAPSVKAANEGARRDKAAKAIKAAIVKHKTVAALRREAGQALEDGKPEQADVFLAAAKAAAKDEEKQAKEKQAARWTKVAAQVKAAKAAHDERILAAIEKAIATLVPVKAGKAGK